MQSMQGVQGGENEESDGSCEMGIPSDSEIYVCGYGLKRTSENAWISVRFDMSHLKEATVGCVEGKTKPDFKSLDAQLHGASLSNLNEVVMMLASTSAGLILSLTSDNQKIYASVLNVDSAFFGLSDPKPEW